MNSTAVTFGKLPSSPSRQRSLLSMTNFHPFGESAAVQVRRATAPESVPVASIPSRVYSRSWKASEVILPSEGCAVERSKSTIG